MVAIGISSRSYGFFFYNRRESEGEKFLGSELPPPELERSILPGSVINTNWLLAMDALARFGAYGMSPDVGRYRRLQIVFTLRARRDGELTLQEFEGVMKALSIAEKVFARTWMLLVYWSGSRAGALLKKALTPLWRRIGGRLRWVPTQTVPWDPPRGVGRYRDILEAVEGFDPDASSGMRSPA
jgi:hypothetical protein